MFQYVKGGNPAALAWKEYKLNYIWPASLIISSLFFLCICVDSAKSETNPFWITIKSGLYC